MGCERAAVSRPCRREHEGGIGGAGSRGRSSADPGARRANRRAGSVRQQASGSVELAALLALKRLMAAPTDRHQRHEAVISQRAEMVHLVGGPLVASLADAPGLP